MAATAARPWPGFALRDSARVAAGLGAAIPAPPETMNLFAQLITRLPPPALSGLSAANRAGWVCRSQTDAPPRAESPWVDDLTSGVSGVINNVSTWKSLPADPMADGTGKKPKPREQNWPLVRPRSAVGRSGRDRPGSGWIEGVEKRGRGALIYLCPTRRPLGETPGHCGRPAAFTSEPRF